MSASSLEPAFADSLLNEWLSGMGLGVEYVRAEGNTLYYLDENGQEVPVLDHACGFGSLIFGHHHPEIVAHAKSALDTQYPVHAQLSVQSHANRIATKLNEIIHRETGTNEPYSAVFANSGAEAIEICMKHAELERQGRIAELTAEITAHLDEAREAVRAGSATVADDAIVVASGRGAHDFESLIAEIERRNAERLAQPPVYLTLEGAFHGKLVGSIQLTQNEQWRAPFTSLASSARFVPVDQPEVLAKIIEDERKSLYDVVVEAGVVRVVERDFPAVGAFFVEPIRGGAGMKPVTAEFAREIEKVCEALGCPLVVDEVQSGMGRSGAFLASSHMGLRGDYYTLAKSIGGGIAKNSVVLVRQDRFRPEFEVIHSSTFAKDGFSGAIALKVLDMLEADDGRAYRLAAERGERLIAMLNAVRADFPEVLKEVWGLGLMLAVELQDQSNAASEIIREKAQSGVLGFLIAGYILREHRIRVLPAGPGWNFVRFEPSIYLTDEDIERTEAALRSVCTVLRDGDGKRLVP
ncbi:aspartate aminotransferase family protein [Amycolatopsis anabasis]|uniref:aspartate aminotransferase family protein n=1 Tax=Amycolatopsis anabasis TaxID=1840409 RepID=UPI00131B2F33|nr:aminotransferase class III-fold pyridoxal phosphate-dependent enzyme [Amycolatopsis anabasis]